MRGVTSPDSEPPSPGRLPPARPLPLGRGEGALSFPRWAHVPGVTAGADHPPLAAAKALLPARFVGPVPAGHPAVDYGIALCDAEFFWEAHEVLEAAWKAAPLNGRDREALRALIQLANAGLKLRMAKPKAAGRLLEEASERLREARAGRAEPGLAAALDLPGLGAAVQDARSAVERASADPGVPAIRPFVRP